VTRRSPRFVRAVLRRSTDLAMVTTSCFLISSDRKKRATLLQQSGSPPIPGGATLGVNPVEITRAAVDSDRLIEGEDPDTPHAEDARHWLVVYTELVAYKEAVLLRTRQAAEVLGAGSAEEIREIDIPLLERERDRLRNRLEFWRRRVRELGSGVGFDQETRLIRHGGGSVRLTRREAELFAFLLTHPDGTFSAQQLTARAWQTPELSPQQVRNYVVRLRRKLATARLPCAVISDPGAGYTLKWRVDAEARPLDHEVPGR
jgi:DNA-binding winged helix-turn-helix (wHTH) protein